MSSSKALIIIGNGFDLQLNLKSSYQSFYDHLNKTEHSNMWPTLIQYNNMLHNNLLWKDLEYAILNFLIDETPNKINMKNVVSYDTNLEKVRFQSSMNPIRNTLEVPKNKDNRTYSFRLNHPDLLPTYNNVLKQVLDLENLFGNYMRNQTSNIDYNNRAFTLLKEIITANNIDKITDFAEIQILNFNYTNIMISNEVEFAKIIFRERNIHGRLSPENDNHNIIFGIDSTRFNIQDKPSLYQFTKTFRVMNNNIKSNLSKQIKIPQELDYIYFYGHSLGEQDYSYFQSIFDTIDLYYSKTILRFIFSDNFLEFPEDKHNHKLNTSSQVAKLIEIYGESFGQEKLRGKNLLHKLIVENRLEIILLNPDSTKPKE